MTKIERLREKLRGLEYDQMQCYRRGDLMGGDKFKARIATVKAAIADLDLYEPKPLGELLDPATIRRHKICEKIVELHMAADYLADCASELRETFGKVGLADCSLFGMTKEIESRAAAFADIVCKPEFAGLQHLIVTNERLIDDLHLLARRYVSDHLDITWKDQLNK